MSGGYRFGYQGSEKDNEFKGDGNSYTTEFRQLDPRLGMWLTIDPEVHEKQSPYCSFDNSPILLTDPDGKSAETTIVGKTGKVLDVINDGKTDIVQFSDIDESKWKGTREDLLMKTNGKVVGQTIFWHDFMTTDDQTIYNFKKPAYGEQVLNDDLKVGGEKFNGSQIGSAASKMFSDMIEGQDVGISLGLLAKYSRTGKIFDIKRSLGYSEYEGIYMGTVQNNLKVYTSLRVLGDMVFGANMEIARQKAPSWDRMDFWKSVMVPVGEYNIYSNNVQCKLNYPYYGEHILSGRAIWLGYWGYKFPAT